MSWPSMSWALWLVPLAVTAAADSILEMMDVRQVERLLAERRMNSSRDSALERNLLEEDVVEDYPELQPRRNATEDLLELLEKHGDKVLRSSKEALQVTKKQYLRKDWCRTEPLLQEVKEEGCAPVTVLNHFCYGQCNSFFIPRGTKRKSKVGQSEGEQAAFRSCAFCRPKRSSWTSVTLRCRRKKRVILRRKRVLRVRECKCVAEPVD